MTQPDSEQVGSPRLGLPERVLLALSPALAYIIAFRFEASYLGWYGLPSELVELSLDRIVAVWTILLFVVLSLLVLVATAPAWRWGLILSRVFTVIMALSSVALFLVLRPATGIGRWLLTGLAILSGLFFLLLLLLEIVVPLLAHPELPNWLDRYAKRDALVAAKTPPTLMSWFAERMGFDVWLWFAGLIFLFFMGLPLAGFVGKQTARLNGRHLVVSGPPECAVIRRYGNHLLCLEIDRTVWRFGRGLRVLAMDRMSDELVHVEDLYLRPPSDTANTSVVQPGHSINGTRRK
jgi:hypothetical protein